MLNRAARSLHLQSIRVGLQRPFSSSFSALASASLWKAPSQSAVAPAAGISLQRGVRALSDVAPKSPKRKFDRKGNAARRERERKHLVCFNCRREGHHRDDCTQPTICMACGGEGHQRKDCPNPDPARIAAAESAPSTCFRCGEEGHKIEACTQPPACYGCGQPGHRHDKCPTNPRTRFARPAPNTAADTPAVAAEPVAAAAAEQA